MTAQQEPEYRITESELKEYARLKAHENSADFAPLSKVHELSEKYESEIRPRVPIKRADAKGIPIACRRCIHDKGGIAAIAAKAREEVLNEICAINKGDGCCNGQPHGKDCFDCAFIHLRSEVKKE